MQNVEYIELLVKFSRNYFTIGTFSVARTGQDEFTDRPTDRQMVLSFTFICWTVVVIHKCFEFSELQFSVYFTEETDNQRLF